MTETPTPTSSGAGELLACPFCDETDELDVREKHGGWFAICGACGGAMYADSRAGAIAGWNARAPTHPISREAVAEKVREYLSDGSTWIDDDYLVQGEYSLADAIISLTIGRDDGREARLRMFLEILSAMGGESDASESKWSWINAFCEEHEGCDPDTFNLAEQRGFTTVGHDTSHDTSTVSITGEGLAFLTTPLNPSPYPHRTWTQHLDYAGEQMHPGQFREPCPECLGVVEALEAITQASVFRDAKWAGMSAKDIARTALQSHRGEGE